MAGVPNIVSSSTNPTLPYRRDAVAEHLAMIMAVHDLGVIPITSSDAQGMGRAGETWARTFALAAAMRAQRGPLTADATPTTTPGSCAT